MKLKREDFEFNNRQICLMTPRLVNPDTVLINLYMLLRFEGKRPTAKSGRQEVTIDDIVEQLIRNHGDRLQGFAENRTLVRDWIYSDLVNMVNRGIEGREEKVAAPLPFHLNAFKLRNPEFNRDYGSAEQVYSMIYGDSELRNRLKQFLGEGMNSTDYERYDEETALDLDTLTIVRMVDNPNLVEKAGSSKDAVPEPICGGQARLLQYDLRCLLAYRDVVPRSALISYIRTIICLHMGLYLLRLFRLVTGWVRSGNANVTCLNCPVMPSQEQGCFQKCAYAFQHASPTAELSRDVLPELIVDLGDATNTPMAVMAIQSCASHYSVTQDYMQAMFTVNQLRQFSNSGIGKRELRRIPQTIAETVAILGNPPAGIAHYFDMRIDGLFGGSEADEDEERPEVTAIREMRDLAPLDKFVQLVMLGKSKLFQPNLVKQLDSFFMKNSETGLMRQGKGARNPRRWHLSSGLLEVLVQIAVLEPASDGKLHSRPILIDDFVQWMRDRYGITVLPNRPNATMSELQASNDNQRNLAKRLREIGFYTDLSDAYNTQTIRPRYPIEAAL